MRPSPLSSAQPDSVSVCGRLLRKGQAITVHETAIGPRERKMETRRRISIRPSNKEGYVQVVCTLGS